MDALTPLWARTVGTGPGCEPDSGAWLTEPVSAVTSLAFVAVAVAIPAAAGVRRGVSEPGERDRARAVLTYAALVAGIGVGSVVQHGPDPAWSDLVHDLPLVATLAFVAADAGADLLGRRSVPWWWWVVPTLAVAPVIVAAPRPADLAQVGLATLAIGSTLARARARPPMRRRAAWAMGLLAVGGAIGSLSRAGGPLCVPESLWQGHAAWHVLAALALLVLAPTVGRRGGEHSPRPARGVRSRYDDARQP